MKMITEHKIANLINKLERAGIYGCMALNIIIAILGVNDLLGDDMAQFMSTIVQPFLNIILLFKLWDYV